jgi:single-stranded-DNA-specific exonuclease
MDKTSLCQYKSTILKQIEEKRGISDDFYYASASHIPDINLFKDIDKAAKRILAAVRNRENILIFGHDDLDGITSAFILYDYLTTLGSENHDYYIPNRIYEDHGIQTSFISAVQKKRISLVITVDGGITSVEAVEKINQLGCDVIITDHHLVGKVVPEAYAIINPKQSDCRYPFNMLAGVAVTYFLIEKLSKLSDLPTKEEYLLWVALGTIADKVPLVGANRILVKQVLNDFSVQTENSEHIKVIKNTAGVAEPNEIIQYLLKLLSGGRELSGEHKAMSWLLNPQNKQLLDELKEQWATYDEEIAKLKSKLEKLYPSQSELIFIYFDENNDIPHQLLGYAANYLTDKFRIPLVMLKEKEGGITCEARCQKGFNLVDMFTACRSNLSQYGGHKQAAGFTAKPEDLGKIKKCFTAYAEKKRYEIEKARELDSDAEISTDQLEELRYFLEQEIESLKPFGQGNPHPIIKVKGFVPKRDLEKLELVDIPADLKQYDSEVNIAIKVTPNSLQLINNQNEV